MSSIVDVPGAYNLDSPAASDLEKQPVGHTDKSNIEDLINELGDHGAHLLDAHLLQGRNIQTTADGKTILIPQPSADPNDPLNWSKVKKHIILFVFAVVGFLPDYASSVSIVTLLPQAMYVSSGQPVIWSNCAAMRAVSETR